MRALLTPLLVLPFLAFAAGPDDPVVPDAEWVFDEPAFLAMMTGRHQAVAAGSPGTVAVASSLRWSTS